MYIFVRYRADGAHTIALDLVESEMWRHFYMWNLQVSSGEIIKRYKENFEGCFFFFYICSSVIDLPAFGKINLKLQLVEELVWFFFFFPGQ